MLHEHDLKLEDVVGATTDGATVMKTFGSAILIRNRVDLLDPQPLVCTCMVITVMDFLYVRQADSGEAENDVEVADVDALDVVEALSKSLKLQ